MRRVPVYRQLESNDCGPICLGLDEISDMIFVNDKVVCVLLAPDDNFLSVNPHLNEKNVGNCYLYQ